MKQTLQSILTASDAVLFPAISRNHSLNSVFCITESDVFRCNEEIAVFLQDPDFHPESMISLRTLPAPTLGS